ncbi:hypothetical protein ABG768_017198 [Culter alburnus]|uniref:Uncharacterized protein n=1 Tax=Culter alburnus TaxID=194366 RepID=A0AAW1YVI7_CULAL
MLLKVILCIPLLVAISTANRGFIIQCEGESTTLSCLGPRNHTEGKVEINALWKKDSGERVIWKYYGHNKTGDSYRNRKIKLNDNLSLSIEGCDQSDQGIYILCINEKPSCEVRLFVKDSKQCTKPKTSTEQSTRSPEFMEQAATDEKNLQNETSLQNTYIRWIIVSVSVCLFGMVLLLLVYWIQRRKTSKNDKSGTKLLHTYCTEAQSNNASA